MSNCLGLLPPVPMLVAVGEALYRTAHCLYGTSTTLKVASIAMLPFASPPLGLNPSPPKSFLIPLAHAPSNTQVIHDCWIPPLRIRDNIRISIQSIGHQYESLDGGEAIGRGVREEGEYSRQLKMRNTHLIQQETFEIRGMGKPITAATQQ
ncbi:hypothetical protein BGZ63DRAFT_458727 [Mariannaea sp. PMI_226]|nr:hypothetical protein BGZ63DRAFT_458727 [Mariannaea sp. PMI_226]